MLCCDIVVGAKGKRWVLVLVWSWELFQPLIESISSQWMRLDGKCSGRELAVPNVLQIHGYGEEQSFCC